MRLADSDEDMEGSFDNDVLIGDGGTNAILGQPGEDRIYGGGGEDVLDARDGVRDAAIQCAPRHADRQRRRPAARGARRAGRRGHAFIDPFDPHPVSCGETTVGHPVKGLGKTPSTIPATSRSAARIDHLGFEHGAQRQPGRGRRDRRGGRAVRRRDDSRRRSRPEPMNPWTRAALLEGVSAKRTIKDLEGGMR